MKHPGGAGASGAGHSAKHTRSKKHAHGKAKHNPKGQKTAHHTSVKPLVHTFAKHPSHPRGLAIGDALPVCTFEALAMSLRLQGVRVTDDDVAGLWEACGAREVSIGEALAAVAEHGLTESGRRLSWRHEPYPVTHLADFRAHGLAEPVRDGLGLFGAEHALILGVDLPGPHAVLATPDGWWSWGRLWSPWTTAVSEAWEVSWL